MELESRHRAKAVVCTNKQRAPSEDGDGDSSPAAGAKARGPRPPSRSAKAVVCVSKRRAPSDK